jgi:hypothetical protein
LALINPDSFYHLSMFGGPDNGPLIRQQTNPPSLFVHRDFNDENDYYYIEVKDGDALSCFMLHTLVDRDVLTSIRNPECNVYLVICNSHEAFHSVVEPIYKYVVLAHHIPAEKIILMSGSFDIVEEIERSAKTYHCGMLKAELVMDFEVSMRDNVIYHLDVHNRPFAFPETLKHKKYKKKFINFNRRWRPARPTFVALLAARGLLEQGHVSLAPADCGSRWPEYWNNIYHMNNAFPQLLAELEAVREHIINLPPLYLDTPDLVTNRANLDDSAAYLYEDTYFSLVAETNYYTSHCGMESGRFLSEKAFKPIVFHHPFVFISTPGILQALKQIGYQTFDGIINEDYDQVSNDGDRLLVIAEETQRLCDLNEDQLSRYLSECKEVTDYNYSVFINKNKFTHRLNF